MAAGLRNAGVRRVFGSPVPGLPHVAVGDPELAALLADADGRVGPGMGAACMPGGRLRVSSRPGGTPPPLRVTTAEDLVAALPPGAPWLDTVELVLDLDLDEPAPADLPLPRWGHTLELRGPPPDAAGRRGLVLAGPLVGRLRSADQLGAFARRTGWPVVNSWGAKGLFRWDDPYHGGTVGLQAGDAALAGLAEAEVVVTVGLDPDETPEDRWRHDHLVPIEPWHLPHVALGWPPPPADPPPRPPLYGRLAEALAPLYSSDTSPRPAARAAADLAAALPPGGLVAADPGLAGLWVARAFPTRELGSALVPATVAPGFAAAAALVAGLDRRPAVAVTTAPVDPATEAVLALAGTLGQPVRLEVWGGDGPVDVDPSVLLEVAGPLLPPFLAS